MPISSIEAIPVEMPVKPLEKEFGLAPYVSNHASVETVDRTLIRLETTDGTVGWGEMLTALKSPTASKAIIEDVIAPKLIGCEVGDISSCLDEFYHPYVKIDPFLGGVSIALWDLLGKRRDAPIHELLGGVGNAGKMPIAFCLGILDPEESRRHARYAVDAGFETLKTKAGPDWKQDVERLVAMNDETDGELEFRLDPNQGWTLEESIRALSVLEENGVRLQYIEQPVRINAFGSYESLRNRTRTPIAVNEDTYFNGNLRQLLGRDAIDVAVIDLVPAGGLLRARDQISQAEAANVSVSHHCGFDLGIKSAAVCHLFASAPALNLSPDSVYYAWETDVLHSPLEVSDGALTIPNGPGLGIDVDETIVENHRID